MSALEGFKLGGNTDAGPGFGPWMAPMGIANPVEATVASVSAAGAAYAMFLGSWAGWMSGMLGTVPNVSVATPSFGFGFAAGTGFNDVKSKTEPRQPAKVVELRPVAKTAEPEPQTPKAAAATAEAPPKTEQPSSEPEVTATEPEPTKPEASATPPAPTATARAEPAEASAPAQPEAAATPAGGPTRPPALEDARGGKADDLKMISGVGPKLEMVLNDIGIFHFDQIAAWSKAEIDWVDDYLKFKGRIERDDWIAQAGALAAGGPEEYRKRFGKDPR